MRRVINKYFAGGLALASPPLFLGASLLAHAHFLWAKLNCLAWLPGKEGVVSRYLTAEWRSGNLFNMLL